MTATPPPATPPPTGPAPAAGRAPAPIALGPGPAVVAVDVGGTSTKVALVGQDGVMRAPRRVPSPRPGPDAAAAVIDIVADLVAGELAGHGAAPAAVGLAVPGIVDDEAGIGRFSENLGWRDADFRALAAARFDLPVAILHDVRAAGQAEQRLGAARGRPTALVVTIGTGIAAAVLIEGRAHVAHGYAGEIGHAVVVPGGEPCVCGNAGCLEATSSAAAIARRYARDAGQPVGGAKDVLTRVAAGDPVATQVWESALDALALGLSQTVCLLAPDAVVIGGGLAQAGETLLTPLRERLAGLLRVGPMPALLRAELGEDAGLAGAALAARDLLAR